MNASQELKSKVDEALQVMLDRFDGLDAILVSTFEGVPLLQAFCPNSNTPESLQESETFLPGIFALAAEQAGKLKLGPLKTITTFYGGSVLVHVNCMPLVITFIAKVSANTGSLISYAVKILPAFDGMKAAVENEQMT